MAYSDYYAKYESLTRKSRQQLDTGPFWVDKQGVVTVEGDWD